MGLIFNLRKILECLKPWGNDKRTLVFFLSIQIFLNLQALQANTGDEQKVTSENFRAALNKAIQEVTQDQPGQTDKIYELREEEFTVLIAQISGNRGLMPLTAKLLEMFAAAELRRLFSIYPHIRVLSSGDLENLQPPSLRSSLVDGLVYTIVADRLVILAGLEAKLADRVTKAQVEGLYRRFEWSSGINVVDLGGVVRTYYADKIDFLSEPWSMDSLMQKSSERSLFLPELSLERITANRVSFGDYPVQRFRNDLLRTQLNVTAPQKIVRAHSDVYRYLRIYFSRDQVKSIADILLFELLKIPRTTISSKRVPVLSQARKQYYARLGMDVRSWFKKFEGRAKDARWPKLKSGNDREQSLAESLSEFGSKGEVLTRLFSKEERHSFLEQFQQLRPKKTIMCRSLFLSGLDERTLQQEINELYGPE